MKNHLAAAGLAAGLVAGSAAGLLLVPVAAVGQSTPPPAGSEAPAKRTPGGHLRDALAPLVADGTLTQAQLDRVVERLQDARPAPGLRGRGHHIGLDVAAETIGITEAQLREALQSGQSIAAVARSRNVGPQRVIDALVARTQSRLADKVRTGAMTQAQADARLEEARAKITAVVNGERPRRGGKPTRGSEPQGSSAPA